MTSPWRASRPSTPGVAAWRERCWSTRSRGRRPKRGRIFTKSPPSAQRGRSGRDDGRGALALHGAGRGKPGFELGPRSGTGPRHPRRARCAVCAAGTGRRVDRSPARRDRRRRAIAPGDRVALLVNGLGGTPPLELAIVGGGAPSKIWKRRGALVERVYCGTFLSALEMAGVSLSVLRVDDLRLARLDAPTDAPAWPNPGAVARPRVRVRRSFPPPSRRGHRRRWRGAVSRRQRPGAPWEPPFVPPPRPCAVTRNG